jgi:hypothetical protein
MAFNPQNSNGQKTMANSAPVVIASDQSSVPISHTDTAPATQNITAADAASSTGTGANSQAIITGSPTANSAASFALSGQTSVIIQTTGTWVATLQVEVSTDSGTTWYTRGLHQAGTSYTAVSFTGNFAGGTSVAGYTNIRVRATAYTSGTATVKITETLNPNSVYIANSIKLSDSTTPSQQLAIDSAGAISIQSAGATGSAVPSRGIYNAGNAATSLPSAATAGNLTGAMYDKFGRQIIISGGMRDIIGSQRTTITASTSETTIVTAAASTFNDLFLLTIRNTSATAVRVDIRDTTAGTIIDDVYVPAGEMRGWALPQGVAAQTTVNTNWTAQCSASVTDVRITAWFFKNK